MSTNLQKSASSHQLEAILPEYCILKPQHTIFCGAMVALFLLISYLPVSSPTTWNSVVGGSEQANITALVPLSHGIRHIEVGWASHKFIATLHSLGGPELLSLAYTLLQSIVLVGWAALFFRLTGRFSAVFGTVVVALGCFPFLEGLTSRSLGQLALLILAHLLVHRIADDSLRPRWSTAPRRDRIAIGILFAAWANLDASFLIGLGWLLCLVIARAIELVREQGFAGLLSDQELQSRVWLWELAVIATLLNPRGWKLWDSALWWPDNPLLFQLGGWLPTSMASASGVFVFLTWAAWLLISRRRDVAVFWLVTPVAATIAVACCEPAIVWFAPLMLLSVCAAFGRRAAVPATQRKHERDEQRPLRFAYTLVAGLLLWIGFCFSPWCSWFLGGAPRTESQLVGEHLPLQARDHLAKQMPQGIVLCPIHWSDWLQAESGMTVFVNSDTSRVPISVVEDYTRIYSGESNWKSIAQKYGLKRILIEKSSQRELAHRVRQQPGSWKISYEDSQAMLLENVQ